MAKKKSVLAQRVNELEDAVTRLFTGEPPAPKAPARKKAKRSKAKAAAKKAGRKAKKAAKKVARKAKRKAKKARR
jgi:DNA-binding protein HU-beta